jgi:hypothetical protein
MFRGTPRRETNGFSTAPGRWAAGRFRLAPALGSTGLLRVRIIDHEGPVCRIANGRRGASSADESGALQLLK